MACTLFPHQVNIESATLTKDTAGTKRLYPPSGGSVKKAKVSCLIEPLSAFKVVELMHLGFKVTHRLYFPENPELVSTDRIVHEAQKLEVKGEVNVAQMGKLFIVEAEEVK